MHASQRCAMVAPLGNPARIGVSLNSKHSFHSTSEKISALQTHRLGSTPCRRLRASALRTQSKPFACLQIRGNSGTAPRTKNARLSGRRDTPAMWVKEFADYGRVRLIRHVVVRRCLPELH